MSSEVYIKRTIWVAECSCGERTVSDTSKRETHCKCGTWVPYVEQSYVGPSVSNVSAREFDRQKFDARYRR
jgi:hypothetical protein